MKCACVTGASVLKARTVNRRFFIVPEFIAFGFYLNQVSITVNRFQLEHILWKSHLSFVLNKIITDRCQSDDSSDQHSGRNLEKDSHQTSSLPNCFRRFAII